MVSARALKITGLLVSIGLGLGHIAFASLYDVGLNSAATGAEYNTGVTTELFVGSIIQIVLGFTGLLFFLLSLYAGFTWMTARGDSKQVENAKNTLVRAVMGLAIIVAAYAITRFVVVGLSDVDKNAQQLLPEGTSADIDACVAAGDC